MKNYLTKKRYYDKLCRHVCNTIGIEVKLLTLKKGKYYIRWAPVIDAKRLIVYYLREYSAFTTTEIGLLMGVDHSTAIHHVRKAEGFYQHYEWFRTQFNTIHTKMNDEYAFKQNILYSIKNV